MRDRTRHLRAHGRLPGQARARRRRAGFTLVELMVSLVIGALVVAAMFTLGGASSRHFQEQQRVGVTQRSVRMAMHRLTRDLMRAGYMHVPDNQSPFVRTCPTPALARRVGAVGFINDDTAGNAALDTVARGTNATSADRLRIMGNLATDDEYLVRSMDATGSQIFLQTDWLAFRRTFVRQSGGTAVVDVARFQDVFRAGRMLHIETRNGFHFFLTITGSSVDAAGLNPTVTVTPGIGADNPCLEGIGRGAIASVVSEVEYFIGTPPADSYLQRAESAAVTGPNTILYRRELNFATGDPLAGTQRPILEYAIDFNVDFVVDTNPNPGATPPTLVLQDGATAAATIAAQPWQVRSAIVSLAARTPEQDPRLPWPDSWGSGRPSSAPLNRYRVFPTLPGAARVRQLTTEIQMPNMVPR